MAAVIYNCKRCKVGRRVDYPNRDALPAGWTADWSGNDIIIERED